LRFKTLEERIKYLYVGEWKSFDSYRHLNQILYRSKEWKNLRSYILLRDEANDLGVKNSPIFERAIIHHIDPLTLDDVLNFSDKIFDENNLITCSMNTHSRIHSKHGLNLVSSPIERKQGDTKLW